MKDKYKTSVSLRCITCGAADFNFNEDKTFVQCKTCDREYAGGYDELVELNQDNISGEIDELKKEVLQDLKADFTKSLKDAFKGNKGIKLK